MQYRSTHDVRRAALHALLPSVRRKGRVLARGQARARSRRSTRATNLQGAGPTAVSLLAAPAAGRAWRLLTRSTCGSYGSTSGNCEAERPMAKLEQAVAGVDYFIIKERADEVR